MTGLTGVHSGGSRGSGGGSGGVYYSQGRQAGRQETTAGADDDDEQEGRVVGRERQTAEDEAEPGRTVCAFVWPGWTDD